MVCMESEKVKGPWEQTWIQRLEGMWNVVSIKREVLRSHGKTQQRKERGDNPWTTAVIN